MKRYVRFFTEMSPPNIHYMLDTLQDEIKRAKLRAKSDRELKNYHTSYYNYLVSYLDGEYDQHEVAVKGREHFDIDDNSPEAGKIASALFIMNVVRKSIED
jgi:hypothetical protein